MEIYAKRTFENHLIPLDEYSLEEMQKIKLGKEVCISIVQKRNIGFHRKFFVLIGLIDEIQSHFDSKERLRSWLIMKAGYVEEIIAPNGKILYMPKSIKFSKMDQIDFEQLYSKVIDIALQHDKICGGITKEKLLEEYETKILRMSN